MRADRVLAALAFCAIIAPAAAAAGDAGYDIWFSGRVISVDRSRGRLKIMHGPTETSEAGIEECTLAPASLRAISAGLDVRAQADTRRRPWRILHLRVYRRLSPRVERTATA